jgi:cell division protein FtsW
VADWFWTIDRFFLAMFIFLMGIGFMLSFAASAGGGRALGLEQFHFVKRHAAFMMPSLAVMIGLSFMTPRQVRRTAIILLIVARDDGAGAVLRYRGQGIAPLGDAGRHCRSSRRSS